MVLALGTFGPTVHVHVEEVEVDDGFIAVAYSKRYY